MNADRVIDSPPSTSSLPTRAEFCDRVKSVRRQFTLVALICLGGILVLVLTSSVTCLLTGPGKDLIRNIPGYWLLSPFLALVAIIVIAATRFENHPLLKCTDCRYSRYRVSDARFAIVCGRCPNCAVRLFSDDEQANVAVAEKERQKRRDALNSRRELLKNSPERRRQFLRMLQYGGVGTLLIGLGVALISPADSWLGLALGEMGTPFIRPVLLSPGVSILLWTLVIHERWCSPAEFYPPCPHCRSSTQNDCVAKTGNCSTCGIAVLDDPMPGLEPTPRNKLPDTGLGSISEYQRIAKSRNEQLWNGCLLGGLPGLFLILSNWWISPPNDNTQLTSAEAARWLTLLGLFVALLFTGMWFWQRSSTRGLFCHSCDGELLNYYPVVVSSRRCYHCGCEVLPPHDAVAARRVGSTSPEVASSNTPARDALS